MSTEPTLILKPANLADRRKEWEYITAQPADENGFTNPTPGISEEDFYRTELPRLLDEAEGKRLPEGHVPMQTYFLWADETIVGLFRLRNPLTDGLRKGAGHIGYGIAAEYRGQGYASRGLALLIREAKEKVTEEKELFLSVNRNNPASLAVQKKNGAYVHHEDEEHYYTRIPL